MRTLRAGRQERERDTGWQLANGLRYVGLYWTALQPLELYRDADGDEWVRLGPCKYELAEKQIPATRANKEVL
jgi:hypothetical protein